LPLPDVQEVQRSRLHLDPLGSIAIVSDGSKDASGCRRLNLRRASGVISVPYAGRIWSPNAKASRN
jgi:hypothetical protein